VVVELLTTGRYIYIQISLLAKIRERLVFTNTVIIVGYGLARITIVFLASQEGDSKNYVTSTTAILATK